MMEIDGTDHGARREDHPYRGTQPPGTNAQPEAEGGRPLDDAYEPTPAEAQVATVFVVATPILGLSATVLGNVTGIWWPGYLLVVLLLVGLVSLSAWIARRRGESFFGMARQIVASKSKKRA
jgi:hypothetical protein